MHSTTHGEILIFPAQSGLDHYEAKGMIIILHVLNPRAMQGIPKTHQNWDRPKNIELPEFLQVILRYSISKWACSAWVLDKFRIKALDSPVTFNICCTQEQIVLVS